MNNSSRSNNFTGYFALHLKIALVLLISSTLNTSFAQGGGGGGGGISGTGIGCDETDAFSLGSNGFTGSDPTSATGSCGQCCYAGSDLDGDGDQDVSFSTENGVWYQYCNNTGASIDIDAIVDETNNNCNLQGAVFVGASSGGGTIDCSNSEYQEYGSNMNGNGDGFSFSNITVPDGQCAYIFIDGYAGATCGAATIQIVCPCIPPVVAAAASPTTVCSGQQVSLTGSGASTYTWTSGAGGALNSTSGTTVTANPTATTTYTVTGDNGSGCTATAQVVVTVTPPPVPNAGSDQSGCVGTTFTIGADPIYGIEGTSYSWSSGASGTLDLSGGGQNHGTTTVSPATTTTYTVTINDGGCIGTDQVTITVNPSVTATFNAIGPLCQNQNPPTPPTTSTNGVTGTWSSAVSTATAGTTNYTFTPTAGQCATGTSMSITVNPLPTPNAGTDQSDCAGTTFTIGNDPVYTQEGASYSWSSGASGTLDLSGGGQNHGTTTVSPGSTTTYTLTVTGLNGCSNTDQMVVTIDPCGLPVDLITFNAACDDVPVLKWSTASESNNDHFTLKRSCDGQQFSEIARIDGAGNSTTIREYSFADFEYGRCDQTLYYQLMQTDFNGDSEQFNTVALNCVTDKSTPFISVKDKVISIDFETAYSVLIFSANGQLIQKQSDLTGRSTFDLINVGGGLYFVQVISDELFSERVILP